MISPSITSKPLSSNIPTVILLLLHTAARQATERAQFLHEKLAQALLALEQQVVEERTVRLEKMQALRIDVFNRNGSNTAPSGQGSSSVPMVVAGDKGEKFVTVIVV